MLVRDNACTVLATHAVFLGDQNITNNVAELRGFISGLELVRDFLAQSADPTPGLLVTVRGDSRLIIDIVQDRIECRDPTLEALADRAGVLVEELEARRCEISYQHVRREFNVEADKLSNDAMDARSSSLTHTADFASSRASLPQPKPDAADASEPEAEDAEAEAGPGPRPAQPARHIPRLTAVPSREQLPTENCWLAPMNACTRSSGACACH